MSSLTDRLRGIVGGAVPRLAPDLRPADEGRPPGRDRTETGARAMSRGPDAAARTRAAGVLGGSVSTREGGSTILVERYYDAASYHGRVRLREIVETLGEAHEALALLVGGGLKPAVGSPPPPCQAGAAFSAGHASDSTRSAATAPPRVEAAASGAAAPLWLLDLETTGLAGGAGTQAFLVGCAALAGGGILVRQILLPGYEHEPALLAEMAAWTRGRGTLVTFNGKSFDVPLIETRYLFHRLPSPLGDLPHADMLHPARRFWKAHGTPAGAVDASCSLGTLERRLAGVHRIGDVPGFEIPSRYFQFVRDGNARPLEAVLEHNRLDLLSLALVLARALHLVDRGPAAARDPYECLGLAGLYDRAGRVDDADAAYGVAIDRLERIGRDPDTCARALCRLAWLRRRAGRAREAVAAWQRLAELPRCPTSYRAEAREALAIFNEHRARDLASARRHAERLVHDAAPGRAREAAEHRLRRIDRKLAGRSAPPLW